MDALFTPWRYPYISGKPASESCFFCAAIRALGDPERLVVHHTDHHLVILNRHPYTNGHLMVAPKAHLASPRLAPREVEHEFWPLVLRCQEILERAYGPDGFNLGMNLGSAAGAGVPGHYHFHVVPRWAGDTNFMTAVGELRLIPEELGVVWEKLRRLFGEGEHG